VAAAKTGNTGGEVLDIWRIGTQPDHTSPGALGYAHDVVTQAGYGIQKGFANFVAIPYRLTD